MNEGLCRIHFNSYDPTAGRGWGVLVRGPQKCVLVTAALACTDPKTGVLFKGEARLVWGSPDEVSVTVELNKFSEDVISGLALFVVDDERAHQRAIPIALLAGPNVSVATEANLPSELPFEHNGKPLQVKLTDQKRWSEVGVADPLPEGLPGTLHGVPLFKGRWLIGIVNDGTEANPMGVVDGRTVAALVRQKAANALPRDRSWLKWSWTVLRGSRTWVDWSEALAAKPLAPRREHVGFASPARTDGPPARLLDLLTEDWTRGFLAPLLAPLVVAIGAALILAVTGLGVASQHCGIESVAARIPALLFGSLLTCVVLTALFVSVRGALVGALVALAPWGRAALLLHSCVDETTKSHSSVLVATSTAAFIATAAMTSELPAVPIGGVGRRATAFWIGQCFTLALVLGMVGWQVLQIDAVRNDSKLQALVTAIVVWFAVAPTLILTTKSPRVGLVRRMAAGNNTLAKNAYAPCAAVAGVAAAYASFAVHYPVLDQFGVGLIVGSVAALLLVWTWPLVNRPWLRWVIGAAPAGLFAVLFRMGFASHVRFRAEITNAALETTGVIFAVFCVVHGFQRWRFRRREKSAQNAVRQGVAMGTGEE